MKTVEEFIIEINRSAELQNAIKAIKDRDALADFLKKNDVGGTVDDFESAVKERANAEGALPTMKPDRLQAVHIGGFLDQMDFRILILCRIIEKSNSFSCGDT